MVRLPLAATPPAPLGRHETPGSQVLLSQLRALAQLTGRAETEGIKDGVQDRVRRVCPELLVWKRLNWRPSTTFEKDEDRMHPQEMSSQLETLCKRLATLKEGL